MTMSEAEVKQAQYNARKRDFIATAGLNTSVEIMQLKSGKWRAYLRDFVTPWSPRGHEAETQEVLRDGYGNIITAPTRELLISKIHTEYSGWKWLT